MKHLLDRQTLQEVLELSERPTRGEVKANYKRLIKKYHPDVCKDKDAEEYTKRLNQAYAICMGKALMPRQVPSSPPPSYRQHTVNVWWTFTPDNSYSGFSGTWTRTTGASGAGGSGGGGGRGTTGSF